MKAAYATYVHMCTLHASWCNLWIEYRPRMGHQQNRRYSLVDEYEGCWAKHKSKTTNWKVDANWKRTSVKHIEHHITIELNLNELKHLVFKNIKCSQSSSDGQKKVIAMSSPVIPRKESCRLSRAWDPPGTHPTPKNDPEGAQKGHKGSSLQTFKIVSILRNICPTCGFERGVVDPGVQPYVSRLPHTGQRPLLEHQNQFELWCIVQKSTCFHSVPTSL